MKKRALRCICAVAMVLLLSSCSGVNRLIKDIATLENVTLESGEAIEKALQRYEELDEEDKAKVTNIDVLESAKATYAVLDMQEKMKAVCASSEATVVEYSEISQAYDEFSDEQKEMLDTEIYTDFNNRHNALELDKLIEESAVDASASNFEVIDELMTRYNGFNDATKAYTKKYELLESTHAKYKDEFVTDKVNEIKANTNGYMNYAKAQYDKFKHLMTREQKVVCLQEIARWGKVVDAAENELKSSLKSPKSYEKISLSAGKVSGSESFSSVDITITYSAMNGFGGYSRGKETLTVYFSVNPDTDSISIKYVL